MGAHLGGQRGAAALACIELDCLGALRAALDGELWVALLAARSMHESTQLGERARGLVEASRYSKVWSIRNRDLVVARLDF